MFARILKRPSKTFFLIGPRGTGKTTWLKTQNFDLSLDLLKSKTRLDLERDPSLLQKWTAHLNKGSWILLDEVQKIPALLDEVHSLYEERGLQFALSGSSSRKLKRSGANLLAGRALNYKMFPLVFPEYRGSVTIRDRIKWGTLPIVLGQSDRSDIRNETLESYVDNYLRQELIEEGIVRKLDPFSRFLQVAAIMNGQILNVENIARDAKVGRTTVDKYFEILIDTLIGYRLPAYQPGIKTKEITHSKFYFFDPGVARAAAGQTREQIEQTHLGFLFETFLLNEVRAYNDYSRQKNELFYYAVRGGGDIDLIIQLEKKTISRPDKVVAIEIKHSDRWSSSWSKMLLDFYARKGAGSVKRLLGVYTGARRIKDGPVEVFPVDEFLEHLFDGKIF